jgi:UDP-2,3-diacylglucosamine pyrophosphatase LpxH
VLVVFSDIHLWDGTLGLPVKPQTFSLFASRLRELVFQASWRSDGKYRPVESVDILFLGDILDPLQSTRWYDESGGFIRPWSDVHNPLFAKKLGEITRAILENNSHAGSIFKHLTQGEAVVMPPPDSKGKPDFYTMERIAPKIRIHYMVGNHDWYYHIPGPEFDKIRSEIIQSFGLSNHVGPFPHDSEESGLLTGLFMDYELVARHGDIFDYFTYNHQIGRDSAALSDIYSSEVIFRFPLEIERQLAGEIPPTLQASVRQITNVRPLLAAPLWLRRQISNVTVTPRLENKVKGIWNDIVGDFLKLDAVYNCAQGFGRGEIQALRLLLMLSQRTSLSTMADIAGWLQKKGWGSELSIARFASRERDIRENRAKFVVYGHTHSHEVISLDSETRNASEARRAYVNTGTWGSFHDLAMHQFDRTATGPSNLVTCVAFYKDGERNGRRFEPWWANFS